MASRSIFVHGAILLASGASAFAVWSRDKTAATANAGEVTLWSGSPDAVSVITYEGKGKKVTLESKTDPSGRWYHGTVDQEGAPAGDAGAPATPKRTLTFDAGSNATKLAEHLATLRAARGLGKIPADQAADFGLAQPEATITIRAGSVEHKLQVGGSIPGGGGDRYALDPAKGETYVIKGDVVRDLELGEPRLAERNLHDWKDVEPTAVKISGGGKARSLVRSGPEEKKFWADAQTPQTNDETAGNWMTKVDRLRTTEFVNEVPAGATPVVRIEFRNGSRNLGFLEITKTSAAPSATSSPAGPAPKFDYWAKSEHTHMLAKITGQMAEQIDQDLGSIVH